MRSSASKTLSMFAILGVLAAIGGVLTATFGGKPIGWVGVGIAVVIWVVTWVGVRYQRRKFDQLTHH
jgi:uncharacterized membrane protein (DUF485 family)